MTRKQIEQKKKELKSKIASNPSRSDLVSELIQLGMEIPTSDWGSSDGGSSYGDSGGGDCGCSCGD